MIIFSKLVYSAIKLNTLSALLLVWILTVIIELIRRRQPKGSIERQPVYLQIYGRNVCIHRCLNYLCRVLCQRS